MKYLHNNLHRRPQWFLKHRDRGFHESRTCIEAWEPVARTRNNMEELRDRVHKIERLRQEQQPKRLTEMPQYPVNRENHACEVAVRIPHKDLGGIPVVEPESGRDADEGEEQVYGEEVGVCGRMRGGCEGGEVEDVVYEDEDCDDEGLGDFDAVYACEDVD